MIQFSPTFITRQFISSISKPCGAFTVLAAVMLAMPAKAQEIYSFNNEVELNNAMLKLAAKTARIAKIPKSCHLHIVTIAGGRDLFKIGTFDAMNEALVRGVLGEDRLASCRVEMHELGRDSADTLLTRISSQDDDALVLEATYIPLSKNVAVYTKLRNSSGQLIGESGRFDLPVSRTNLVPAAAPNLSISKKAAPKLVPPPAQKPAAVANVNITGSTKPAPKLTNKFLTEVHFDSGSADVTFVGHKKIKQAIEAIKKHNPQKVRILGFTDSKGPAAANKAMAGARAQSVARLLKEAGIDLPLEVEGRGEEGGPHKIPDGISEPLNRCVGIIAVGVPSEK